MTDKEFLIAVKEYIEDVERHGDGAVKRDHYRDLKDIIADGEMPMLYSACLARIKRKEITNN